VKNDGGWIMRKFFIVMQMIFATVVLFSCSQSNDEESTKCESKLDCPFGQECVDGECVKPGEGGNDNETVDDAPDTTPCDPGDEIDCYEGPDGTDGIGICKIGKKKCNDNGIGYSECVGQVLPEKDKCTDNLDNDCNGVINDGYESGAEGCLCKPKTSECLDGENIIICNEDGTAFTDAKCDPLQGLTCSNGACDGDCSAGKIGINYIGCDYYPTVLPNSSQLDFVNFKYAVAVSNSNSSEATVTVTQNDNVIVTESVPGNSMKIIFLNWTSNSNSTMTSIKQNEAYRLRSTKPVTLYQFNPLDYQSGGSYSYSNDASILMPTNAWNKEYMVASRASIEDGPGYYVVVASEDNTTVTATPSPTGNKDIFAGAGINMDGTGTVVLNEGDVLHVASAGKMDGLSVDISGTIISADKPVQVFGGHNCTYVPYDQTAACDHLEESMFPIATLGSDYIVSAPWIKLNTVKAVMTRIFAVDEGDTTLTFDPPNAGWPATIFGRGSFVEIDSDMAFKISADKRILVAQYMKGQGAGGNTGDPALTLAVPVVQYRNNYLFHAPVNYDSNFVNVIAPGDQKVLLDGVEITGFIPIGSTGYSTANVQLSGTNQGNYNITSEKPFFINVYGYGDYTSYWYPGGLNLIPQK